MLPGLSCRVWEEEFRVSGSMGLAKFVEGEAPFARSTVSS